jgi:hypothetical protein
MHEWGVVIRYCKGDEETYTQSRYINAHDLLLGSSLRNTDEERNDIIFPVQLLRNSNE